MKDAASTAPARAVILRAVTLPPPLRRGDAVRVIAPSSPFEPAQLERGLAVLRDRLGLVPRMRPDLVARAGYLAGDDARRLAEWREAVADPEARAIFCARGGYGAMRLLPATRSRGRSAPGRSSWWASPTSPRSTPR